jgi:hypothetical protein
VLNSLFLGIIALAALAQTAFLIALAIGARRLALRVGELRELIEKDMRPALDEALRVAHNLTEISDMGVAQAKRIDAALTDALDKVKQGSDAVSSFVVKPLGVIGNATAFFRGLRRGLEVYVQLRKPEPGAEPERELEAGLGPAEDEERR